MAQKLLNSDLAELIGKMKLAQQYVMTRYVHKQHPAAIAHVFVLLYWSFVMRGKLMDLNFVPCITLTLTQHLIPVKTYAKRYILCCFPSLQQDYKKQMLTAAHALAVDAKNLLDVIDQARLKLIAQGHNAH